MTTNNCVDYGQTAEDHRSLLILVRHAGTGISSQMFNCAYEKISRINGIHVEGQKRHIVINYRKSYSTDFNSWGDFQAHRKVLGLISIGTCSDQKEFDQLFTGYKKIKNEYSSSIINSRFIVFGLNTDGTPICDNEIDNNNESGPSDGGDGELVQNKNGEDSIACDSETDSKSSSSAISNNSTSSSNKKSANGTLAPLAEQEEDSEIDHSDHLKPQVVKIHDTKSQGSSPRSIAKRQHSNSLTKESSGAEIVFYPSLDKSVDFEDRIKEFVTSLFYVLEGKRLDRSFERNDKLSLLCAPFERKDYVGVDTDTKSFRKKCMGRLRKHLGDLCLQACMPGEAILHYNTALDLLKSVNDFLWMAGCLEGLCCSSIILSSPKTPSHGTGLRRNLSFQAKGSALNIETKARAGSSSYANGLDTLADVSSQQTLNQDDVIDKFKESITYYSKFKNAAAIEMETSLKACRFLIRHHRYLQASDFLQNVVYINLPSLEDDKIQRYNTLSSLYHQIGFRRKAAFFKRISGMHCTVPDTAPNWSQCYNLLLQCLEGYGLSVDPWDMDKGHPKGWPVLQYRVLHELVFAARRTNSLEVAVRHMTLLVHRMLPYMSVADQREALNGLATLTAKAPLETTKPLALDHGGPILPPVVLLSLPSVRSFKLVPPSRHLQPHTPQGSGDDDNSKTGGPNGIFIYTPLSLSSSKADDSRPDFKWVCGDVCEATLQVANPLVDDLTVSKMALITSDVETESICDSHVIPPSSKSTTINLRVKPKEPGTLKVQGYSTVVCGVKSNCRLRDLTGLKPSPLTDITIQVIPCLPYVNMSCSLPHLSSQSPSGSGSTSLSLSGIHSSPSTSPNAEGGSSSSGAKGAQASCVVDTGSVVLFTGQSVECVVTLQNTSEVPLETARVWLEGKGDLKSALSRMIVWSEENIASQLPLQPSHTLCFSLCINGDSNFLPPTVDVHRSPASGGRSGSDSSVKKSLDVSLCLEYSGGEGLQAGYCRKCSLGLKIDILPSVYISKWDVQATDSPSHCRLCLDMVNVSGHPIKLQYGRDMVVSLESQQTKRIGMEVLRLDSSQIDTKPTEASTERNLGRIPSFYSSASSSHSVPDPYSQCMATGLDIRWDLASMGANGKVHVDYLKWSPEQLSVLLLSDIRWDVRVNGHQFSSAFKPRFDIGQMVELAVAVETTEDSWPSDSCLCVQVLQTHPRPDLPLENGTYAVIGSLVHLVEKTTQADHQAVDQHGPPSLTHTCSFCFFYPGWYHFNIFFTPSPSSSSSTQQQQQKASSSSSSSPSSSTSPSLASSSLPTLPQLSSSLSSSSSSTSYNKYLNNASSNSSDGSGGGGGYGGGGHQIRTQQPPTSLMSPVSLSSSSSSSSPQTTSINNNTNNLPSSSSSSSSSFNSTTSATTTTATTSSSSSSTSSSSSASISGGGGGGNDGSGSGSGSGGETSHISRSSNNNLSNNNESSGGGGRSGCAISGGGKGLKADSKTRLAVNPGWHFGLPVRFEIS